MKAHNRYIQHRDTVKQRANNRMRSDKTMRGLNVKRMKLRMKLRLQNDDEYRRRNRTNSNKNTTLRLQNNQQYRERNNTRARERHKKMQETDNYKTYRKNQAKNRRLKFPCTHPCQLSQQVVRCTSLKRAHEVTQRYWAKRQRLLRDTREKIRQLSVCTKMSSDSGIPILHIKLLMNKAQHLVKRAGKRVIQLHASLRDKVKECIQHLPEDSCPTEVELTAAFNGHRIHTASSEPYFWEQTYSLYECDEPIAIDCTGQAHVFKTVKNKSSSASSNDHHKEGQMWECHPQLCVISPDTIGEVTTLLRRMTSTNGSHTANFYLHLDDCDNPAKDNRFGHSLFCSKDNRCCSLLRPARQLSSHFPLLRSMVRRLYEVRRLVLIMQSVKTCMCSGTYEELELCIKELKYAMTNTSVDSDKPTTTAVPQVAEKDVLARFGSALQQVADMRDTYVTSSCDICEQLRKDLTTLQAYNGKRGYDSEKMSAMLDQLYLQNTKYEDVHSFIDSIFICGYCADKLRGNKDVARSTFNQLNVVPTPSCISDLNMFEKTLIKFCMTCVQVLRLGQISGAKRPNNELTAALKGRIAYLPIDIHANARFLPDNLFNIDNLVVLVGSQPTKQQRVWTSMVDINKVHTALLWLKENNQLYKDVPAYTIEDIETILQQRLAGQTPNTCADNTILKKLNEASKSFLYENYTVQPLNSDFPADVMVDYQMGRVCSQGMDIFDADLDLKAYPELFPTGEHGLKDTKRTVKIGTSDYIKSRLLNKDPKFRLNINYLFHCFQVQEVSNMCHSIGHMLKCITGTTMSARELYERLQNRDGEIQSKMFSLMANLRGSKEYFAKLGMDVKWMLKQLGPPTLFVTCSTAEWFSEEFISYLRTVNCTVPNIENMTPAELCAMDPVNVSIHFQQKWNAIFTKLIKNKETPLFGEVEDHFWRLEYQARGAPHVHCLLWIKDAPMLGRNSAEEVKQFINDISTCSMPDADTSPTLHSLVKQFQVHRCNTYCTKTFKKNGAFYKKCRFGFPRPVKQELQINDIIDCMAVSRNKQPRKRMYHLPRNETEQYVNDYNAALLLANQANVDVQYIGHLCSRLPFYITEYLTKHERSEQDSMWQDIFTSTKSLGSNAMSFLLRAVKSRQVGANEAADRLLGHKLHSKSRQLRFADLSPANKAKKVLKPASEIKHLLENDPESCKIFQPHWVLDIYPDRPDELESSSLYDFLAWYEKEKCTRKEQLKLRTLGYSLRRRKNRPYIVTHQVVNPHQSEEQKQLYYHNLLKLFKPWRLETDLCIPGKCYSETYNVEVESLPAMKDYHEKNVQKSVQEEEIETAVTERAKELRREEENETCAVNDKESAFDGCRSDHVQTAMQDLIDGQRRTMEQHVHDDITAAYIQLNIDQKRVVDKVVNTVCHQQQVIRMIVSGQGGTGKSRVIDMLNRLVTAKTQNSPLPVVVAAPTGLAAFSIGGTTIHRMLSLPVEHGKPADYCRLQQEQLTLIRATLKHVKLLIIDEVSMISSLTLLFIHLRLTEIMTCDDLFGGISVLLFGDFLQLPPVKGNQPFIPVTFLEAKQRFGSIGSLNLWQTFQYDELVINVRQNGDEQYANLLSSIRSGKLTDEQQELLSDRLLTPGRRATVSEICTKYNQLVDEGHSPLILMPRTALCNEVNAALLQQIGARVYELTAMDSQDTVVDRRLLSKVQKAYERVEEDTTQTAGLEKVIKLCDGAKVMLKRNKNVEIGLVNGSVGVVAGFNISQDCTVHSIQVKFDHIDDEVKIERESVSFEVLKAVYYTRKQFPLMLAFAVTIHKSQGLSLQNAIVDAGPTNFGPGMVYVALSRVTTRNGLHLIDLDKSRIVCDRKAVLEYNRLRQLYTPHLGKLACSTQKQLMKCQRKRKSNVTAQTVTEDDDHLQAFSAVNAENIGNENLTSENYCSPTKVARKHQDSDSPSQSGCSKATSMAQGSDSTSVFQSREVESLDESCQQELCRRLNLQLFKCRPKRMSQSSKDVAQCLRNEIYRQTHTDTHITIQSIEGHDGNCLFRALSQAVTNSQSQHEVFRKYIVNVMTDPALAERLKQMFANSEQQHQHYLLNMQESGEWGTEKEIAAAAQLLQCPILCYSKYNTKQHCLQYFSPHFLQCTMCTLSCNHKNIYLLNTSGSHYECAIVKKLQ